MMLSIPFAVIDALELAFSTYVTFVVHFTDVNNATHSKLRTVMEDPTLYSSELR